MSELLNKFIQNMLEAREYNPKTYQRGKHPNQYIQGRPKERGYKGPRFGQAKPTGQHVPAHVLNAPPSKKEREASYRAGDIRLPKNPNRRGGPPPVPKEYAGEEKPQPEKEAGKEIHPSHTFVGKGRGLGQIADVNSVLKAEIDNAKTGQEVGTILQDNWSTPIVSDMTNIGVESAKELATAALMFQDVFPDAAAQIGYYGSLRLQDETWNSPNMQNNPQVLNGMLGITTLTIPGHYGFALHNAVGPLGTSHEPKTVIGFNPFYMGEHAEEHERLDVNYTFDVSEKYHIDEGEHTQEFAVAMHQLGRALEAQIDSLETEGKNPITSYEAWKPRKEGADPQYAVTGHARESGEARFAEAFVDYSLNGLPEDVLEAITSDTRKVADIVEEYKLYKPTTTSILKEWFEAREYTATTYSRGRHPNQYIKGKGPQPKKAKPLANQQTRQLRSTAPKIDYSESADSLPKIWSRDMDPIKVFNKFSSQKAKGDQGEDIILEMYRQRGNPNMRKANEAHSNFPVDLIDEEKFVVVEVKTGEVDNSAKAQWWKLSYDGNLTQKAKKEIETFDEVTLREINKRKQEDTIKRKYKKLAELEEKYGKKFTVQTVGLIINNDTHVADIYKFDGFHRVINWKDLTPKDYVGTFNYVQTRF